MTTPTASRCVIATHDHADLDALACQVAMARLCPGAALLRPPSISADTQRFLQRYRDRFRLVAPDTLDLGAVEELVLVDVARRGLLQPAVRALIDARPGLRVRVCDHHPPSPDDVPAVEIVREPLGAAVTLLVEALRARDLDVDPVEATLFALGIHSDTDSLTSRATTSRDVAAAAWLVERGVSNAALRRYLDPPLGETQRRALGALLGDVGVLSRNGVRIGLAGLPAADRPRDLAPVLRRALSLHGLDAIFVVSQHGARTRLFGRSRVPHMNVGELMARLGGSGHVGGGVATLEGVDAASARLQLLTALDRLPPRAYIVRHVMSSPVLTLAADLSLEAAIQRLDRWEIGGAPVVSGDDVLGVLERAHLAAAPVARRHEIPVSRWVTEEVATITPDTAVASALDAIEASPVPRALVRESGRLVGVTHRNDLLPHVEI